MKDRRPLSERFDLTYVRRRTWPGNWTFGLSLVAAVAMGLWLSALALRGDKRSYTAGPLTKAHAMFGNDCAKCHQPDPQRAAFWLPVQDDACLKCHAAGAHPDAERALHARLVANPDRLGAVAAARDCATCHVEHKGADHDLNRVKDHYCIQCHADLAATKEGLADWARRPSNAEAKASHVKNTVHAFASDHPNWRLLDDHRPDTTPLRFEHQVHMNPATPQMQVRLKARVDALKQAGVPDAAIAVVAGRDSLTMSCAACHELDDAGRYMKPINFEQHCAACHGLGTRGGEPIPHGSAIAVFADRYAAKQVLEPPPAPAGSSGGPRKSGPRAAGPPMAAAAPAAVTFESDKALAAALAARVQAKRDELIRVVKPNCAKCHGIEADTEKIPAPNIPDRWLARSRFDHAAHLFISCTDCHGQAVASVPSPQAADVPTWTGRTRDVMLPAIQNCRQCHTPTLAGDSCVMCHDFHGQHATSMIDPRGSSTTFQLGKPDQ